MAAMPAKPSGRLMMRVRGSSASSVVVGLRITISLLLLYLVWEFAFGHLGWISESSFGSPQLQGPRIALIVIVLVGFMTGGHAYSRRALVRDLEDVRHLIGRPALESAELAGDAEGSTLSAGSWIGSLVAIPMGLLIVTDDDPNVPFLFSGETWNHDVVWALASNALLFAILGRIAVTTFRADSLFSKAEALLPSVDLLRPETLAPFSRRGLRSAFLWIGGSSIASVIFVNQRFSWLTGFVLSVTLAIGAAAFVQPMLRLHRRLRATKHAELERIRGAVERARHELLYGHGEAREGERMTGLLAYEERIAAAPEWPLDAITLTRFGLVVALGLGSWVGGAVVDRVLDSFW